MSQDWLNDKLSAGTTILSLVNGMIGAFALILPVFALDTGYFSTIVVILITGAFSFYASRICLLHMANEHDLDTVIYKHFKSTKMKVFYDICVFLNLVLMDFSYFQLIIIQWIGIVPPHMLTNANVAVNAIALIAITLAMKYFQFGINLMALGVISLISYLIFLFWVVVSQQTSNHSELKAFGSGAVELSALMGLAFTIQAFFIPILNKSKNKKQNGKYVLIAFIIGGIAYIYIALMGSYGISQRKYIGSNQNQRTIQGYFEGMWETKVIQVIYLIHFYSVFPQFLLISKERIFGVLKYENSKKGNINSQQIIYILLSIGSCVAVTLLKINIRDIIDLNGAVVGGILFYFIPVALHIKCLYFTSQKIPVSTKNEQIMQEGNKCIEEQPKQTQPHKQSVINQNIQQIIQQSNKDEKNKQLYDSYILECNCSIKDYTDNQVILDLCMMVITVDFGIFVMVNGIVTILKNHNLV